MAQTPKLFIDLNDLICHNEYINIYMLQEIYWVKGNRIYKRSRRFSWKKRLLLKRMKSTTSILEKIKLKIYLWRNEEPFVWNSLWTPPKIVFVMSDGSKYNILFHSNKAAKEAYDVCEVEILEKYKLN